MLNVMTFGAALKAIMKEKDINQNDLAEGISKKQATVSGYVTDKIEPGYKTIKAIAEFLDVPVSDLFVAKEQEEGSEE